MNKVQVQILVDELENEIWNIFQKIREPNSILWNETTSWLEMNDDDLEEIKSEGFEEVTEEKINKLNEFVNILDNVIGFAEEEMYRIEDKYEEYLNKKLIK